MKNKFGEEEQKIILKLTRLCARVEKCPQDIRQYFIKNNLPFNHLDDIIDYLIENEFINVVRYARAFVNDKFKLDEWGKIKIVTALQQKNIPERLIHQAIREKINDKEYTKLLHKTLIKKKKTLQGLKRLEQKQKLTNFAILKGFEPDLVHEVVSKIED